MGLLLIADENMFISNIFTNLCEKRQNEILKKLLQILFTMFQ